MMYKIKGLETKQKFLINLFIAQLVLHQEYDSASDLLLILLRYSFLLTDSPSENNFLKRCFPNHGDMSTKNPNGARYLDPKYSRWISTDPALGEYASGSDAGCGGIYNHMNLSLYHYGGNNPVKYIDPDGRFDWNSLAENNTTVLEESSKVGIISWDMLQYFALRQGESWATGKGDDIVDALKNLSDGIDNGLSGIDLFSKVTKTTIKGAAKVEKELLEEVTGYDLLLDLLISMKDTNYEKNAKIIQSFTAALRPYEERKWNNDLISPNLKSNDDYNVEIAVFQQYKYTKTNRSHTACYSVYTKNYVYGFFARITDKDGKEIIPPEPVIIPIKIKDIHWTE